jgi:hypothetical protein
MICSSLKRLFFIDSVLSNNLRENSRFNWERLQGAGQGGDAIDQLNQGVNHMLVVTRGDGQPHNFMMGAGDTGIIFHSSYLPVSEAMARLTRHVDLRKYKFRAPKWFGVGLYPTTGELMFGYNATGEWVEDSEMEEASKALSNDTTSRFKDGKVTKMKIGRNDPCPCHSGKKFKKCHGKPR